MKKKYFALFLVSLFAVLVLGGVFVFALRMYLGKGLAQISEAEGSFSYNGKILISPAENEALVPDPIGRMEFRKVPLQSIDLSPFGFEGAVFSYFERTEKNEYGITESVLYPTDPDYEAFWPVLSRDRFVYIDTDGKKYAIHPNENLSYPIFSDSIEGVDPFGTEILGFSADASYAIVLSGTLVSIYHTDPTDSSLRVVDKKEVDLKEYGEAPEFVSFVGKREAYFAFSKSEGTEWVALDCASGQTAKSALDPEGEYSPVVDRLYAARLDRKEGEKACFLRWCHILLGTERTSPDWKQFDSVSLFAVSPNGNYAVAVASGEEGKEFLVTTEKRSFSLSSILKEGERVERIDFVHENVIWVTLQTAEGTAISRAYKICF